jgi:hypothetical protein
METSQTIEKFGRRLGNAEGDIRVIFSMIKATTENLKVATEERKEDSKIIHLNDKETAALRVGLSGLQKLVYTLTGIGGTILAGCVIWVVTNLIKSIGGA